MDLKKLSTLLVGYSTGVKPGDRVCISYEPLASDLALLVHNKVVEAGGNVFFETFPEGATEAFMDLASDEQLDRLNPQIHWARQEADVLFRLIAPSNTKALMGVDPARLKRRGLATSPITKTFMTRQALRGEGQLRWVGTEIATQARAQDAGMSLHDFQEYVARAGMLHLEDPIAFWRQFSTWQQTVVDYLNDGRDQMHYLGPNIDLKLSVQGRTWINCGGLRNFPDGEVFTAPVENSVNGWLRLTHPAIFQGNVVEGVYLEVKDGKIDVATATRGQEFLRATLATDDGASIFGENGIGTHENIEVPCGSILFDEKRKKTWHFAAGSGYPNSGSLNESGIHWDMIVDAEDDGIITMDGVVIYKNGAFTIGDHSLKPSFN